MARTRILSTFLWLLPALLFAAIPRHADMPATPVPAESYRPVALTSPAPPREFRGAWITTVGNIDWPSKPGLAVAEQKAELISLLDRAGQLKLNAVIFQVRPASDAMYASALEPWSEYITGVQGRAPSPFYDPLAFAVEEAHKRGLELHAWFNPFRGRHFAAKSPVAFNHISRTHPELIRTYGSQLWIDPGEPAARAFVSNVVMDVVKRYDVDGVQFDDYFYPYPEKDGSGREMDFYDDATWRKYGLPKNLDRDNWRRDNINEFVKTLYQSIKAAKPRVKFGISPFGIWRPMNPPSVRGLDAYAKLYADSRLWLASGWIDYCAPQLYWAVDAPQQSFPALLNWWTQQNVKGRNLWPGLNAAAVGDKFTAAEIGRQIGLIRNQPGAGGEIFYHLRSLTENYNLNSTVRSQYTQAALVPASPWLDATPPDRPKLTVTTQKKSSVSVRWENAGGEPVWKWVLQYRTNEVWTTEILPANQTAQTFPDFAPDVIAISTVDRTGNLSLPIALKKTMPAPIHPRKLLMYE
jgi:uncharacterized lipoprotein YddW (UPF0748 family)